MEAVLVFDGLDAFALQGPGQDHRRLTARLGGLAIGGVDRVDIVTVDLDRVPAERFGSSRVAGEIPAQHRLPRLTQAVDIDDRHQVVESLPAGVLERLPDRALGHL